MILWGCVKLLGTDSVVVNLLRGDYKVSHANHMPEEIW